MKTESIETKNQGSSPNVSETTMSDKTVTEKPTSNLTSKRLIEPSPPDPEVYELQRRRKFTAQYKLDVLKQADACVEPGQIGKLLRREGLYSSHLATWKRQRNQGILVALSAKKRGRKLELANPLASQVAQLEREKQILEQKLRQAELVIEAQKKISEILGIAQNMIKNEWCKS